MFRTLQTFLLFCLTMKGASHFHTSGGRMATSAKAKGAAKKAPAPQPSSTKRSYVSQADIPAFGIEQAIRIPQAIADNYGKSPTKPLRVAQAMDMTPGSSHFRMLCGASIAYGLTEGGYNSETIAITPLGRRIVAPTKENDDLAAKREAFLRPRVIREFLAKYNNSRLPSEQIAGNVLEEMGVPKEKAKEVLALIIDGLQALGLSRDVKNQMYVDLDGAAVLSEIASSTGDSEARDDRNDQENPAHDESSEMPAQSAQTQKRETGRVFITHGKNKEIAGQIRELLTFGGFTPIISIENETISKPVPDKVMDDMRSCSAAIIHVGTDQRLIDPEGKEHKILNQNVLIEIGAAMALYGRKFILLVEKGATLPSNLQGLYEVRYEGEKLDYDATMKLLKAFNDFRG
ncbi:TIR domain-containing protein [Rhodanobacter geophilus]|uniref:TIR domain-containing protein n=1 Tax=Rhodanobacter geophilus TaxID=3162488 RepID=A0ABV3QMF1_9GAMM